jgi:hypothetical protein
VVNVNRGVSQPTVRAACARTLDPNNRKAVKEFLMQRFVMSVVTVGLSLAIAGVAQAQSGGKAPAVPGPGAGRQAPTQESSTPFPDEKSIAEALKKGTLHGRVKVNEQLVLADTRLAEGLNPLVTLKTGERIALQITNGKIVGPVVTDAQGRRFHIGKTVTDDGTCRGIFFTVRGSPVCIGVFIPK